MLVGLGAFVSAFAVVYLVGKLLASLIIALASVAAGTVAAAVAFRHVSSREVRDGRGGRDVGGDR